MPLAKVIEVSVVTLMMVMNPVITRLEMECDRFAGSTDEETVLLEKVKCHHELLDTERKVTIVNWLSYLHFHRDNILPLDVIFRGTAQALSRVKPP